MKKKAMEIGMYALSALIGSMIYSLFGVVGVMVFGSVALLVTAYITNRMVKEFKKDAQAQLEQLKSEFSQPKE